MHNHAITQRQIPAILLSIPFVILAVGIAIALVVRLLLLIGRHL
jgi:hypothetical protein